MAFGGGRQPVTLTQPNIFTSHRKYLSIYILGTVPEDHYSKGILFKGAGNAPHRSEAYITVIQKEILKMFELNQKTKS